MLAGWTGHKRTQEEGARKEQERLDADRQIQRYFDQETTELPAFYVDQVRKDLGALWEWLPAGALNHDSYAYQKTEEAQSPATGA